MSDPEQVHIPGYLRFLWGYDEPQRRGPKPAMTLGDIGAAGADLADREGLGAVSMSRVAKEVGFTTMALYRYVNSKDELLAVMLDCAYGDPSQPTDPERGWRRLLETWARGIRDQLSAHPWILQVPIVGPPLTPRTLMWTEFGLRAFAETKLTEQEKLSSLLVVDGYVRNQTQLTLQLFPGGSAEGLSPIESGRLYGQRMQALLDSERYPALAAAIASGALSDDEDFGPAEFAFGLERILDGISVLVDRRSASSRNTSR